MNKILAKILNTIKNLFFNGLLTILPITLTGLIFKSSFNIIKSWLSPIQNILPSFLANIPNSEIILVLLFIFFVGLLLKILVIKPVIKFLEEELFFKIPLVKPVYSGIKQLVQALTSSDQSGSNQVVIVEFPGKDLYCLGFLTGEFPKEISPSLNSNLENNKFYNIYIPTTPNPTTGYFLMLTKDKFQQVNITRQEAMTIIISGGVITPDKFTK